MCSLYLYSTMIYEPDFNFINTQIIAARTHVGWALTECRILRKWLNLNTNNVVVVGMRRSTQAVYDSWASFQFSQRCTSREKKMNFLQLCGSQVTYFGARACVILLTHTWWGNFLGHFMFSFLSALTCSFVLLYSCTIIYEPDFNCNTQTISACIVLETLS